MRHAFRMLSTMLAFCLSASALATVTASLDRDQIAPGETVQLLLQSDRSPDGQPDLGPLKNDFTILGTSSGSSIQIINGHSSSQTQLSLALSPKHDGKIRIPPLQWGGEQSPPLELTVSNSAPGGNAGSAGGQSGGGATATNGSSHVFITTSVDHNQAYVQAAIVLTVRLYTDQALYQANLNLPASADVLVQPLGKDQQGSESRNGRSYQVVERKYLLSPQRSGQLALQGPTLDAAVADAQNDSPFGNDPFFGSAFGHMQMPSIVTSTRPLHLQAKPISLKVLPRPAGATGANWLPAQSVTLEESWNPASASVHAGEPLTRHLRLSALGLTSTQLPDLNTLMQVPDGIKLYPDKSKADDKLQGTTIRGTREQDIALIASYPGHYSLPAVHLSWWDTTANVQREATLPAHTLDILPSASGNGGTTVLPAAKLPAPSGLPNTVQANPPVRPGQANPVSVWLWVSLGLGVLCLCILLAWWRTRQRVSNIDHGKTENKAAQSVISARAAFKAFHQACRDNDSQAARKHLLDWARTIWPDHPPSGLNALSRLLDDEKLAEPLRELERACYTNGTWRGEPLAHALAVPPSMTTLAEHKQGLPELYP
ncbi:MAG: BatD family protein [Georgfuchsia sp.]